MKKSERLIKTRTTRAQSRNDDKLTSNISTMISSENEYQNETQTAIDNPIIAVNALISMDTVFSDLAVVEKDDTDKRLYKICQAYIIKSEKEEKKITDRRKEIIKPIVDYLVEINDPGYEVILANRTSDNTDEGPILMYYVKVSNNLKQIIKTMNDCYINANIIRNDKKIKQFKLDICDALHLKGKGNQHLKNYTLTMVKEVEELTFPNNIGWLKEKNDRSLLLNQSRNTQSSSSSNTMVCNLI